MSLYPETETTNAVSVSPKREYKEEDDEYTDEEVEYQEESEDESDDEDEAEEKQAGMEEKQAGTEEKQAEEEEEEEEPPTTKAKELWIRFAIMLLWLVAFHLTSSTIVVTCITCLIVNSAKCFGGIIGLAIFVLPAAYAISPERVCNFKFRTLAPTIVDGLYKLDCLVKHVMRAVGDKLSDKLSDKLRVKKV
jgi:hypothetical protein